MAYEVASILGRPLDVIVVRKIGVPSQPEFAMGAVGEDGVVVVERDTLEALGITQATFDRVVAQERTELDRRIRDYRRSEPPLSLEGQDVIIVDDGLATGATARAACVVARARGAARIIVATPVISDSAAIRLDRVADRVVALVRSGGPFAVGEFYKNFDQTSDAEVRDDLAMARGAHLNAPTTPGEPRGG